MAVIQISRVQARRGLQQDLPQLASAEFGWSIDQRRLYIGNGLLGEGAPTEGVTEVLTQYTDLAAVLKNYTFRGTAGGYTVQTGASLLSPTVRAFQDKLDDFANVKDFGAKGDGVTNDTAAINRAITQLYASGYIANHSAARRTLYFPAGNYLVAGDTIKLPPYVRIVGDGIQSTIIQQADSSQSCLFQTVDSLYQTSTSMGVSSATLPTAINVEHLTMQNAYDKDVLLLDSVIDATFFCVEVKGGLSNPTTAGSQAYAGVRFQSTVVPTENINFIGCAFKNVRNVALADNNCYGIRFDSCYISGVYKGFKLGQNSAVGAYPRNFRIVNCDFASVASSAIDTYTGVSGIVSSGNNYRDVGNNFAGVGSPVAYCISFADNGNYSIGDAFDRTDADDVTFKRLFTNSKKSIGLQSNIGLQLSTMIVGTGGVAILADNTAVATASNVTLVNGCTVNYILTRGTGIRSGTIIYMNDGTGPSYAENAALANSDVGVTLAVNSSNVVTYTTTSTGNAATFKYNITYATP